MTHATMHESIPSASEVTEFYDRHMLSQQKTGLNLRHYMIFRDCVKSGLRRDHRVLEIGCGIGTLTGLLARYVNKGHITATDISRQGIAIARERIKARNISWEVTDMSDYEVQEPFDFIVLPDVLEHIPIGQHADLFGRFSRMMHAESVILVNIPHPKNIEHFQKHDPDALQIIDQALYCEIIARNAGPLGLTIDRYFPRSIFHREEDYILVIIRKADREPVLSPLWKYRISLRKQLLRLYFFLKTI